VTGLAFSDAERRDWLRLARTENVGAVTFSGLIQRFGSATAALPALPDLAQRGGRVRPLDIPSVQAAQAELDAGARLGAHLICSGEPDFPYLLAALDHPPAMLWTLGRRDLMTAKSLAMVGARIASAAGQRYARTLAQAIGEAGYTIVSGMARGIDAAAHEGALPTGTVAVLAGGVDDIYPRENESLYWRLAETGCLVSESPIGYKPQARDFPRRNRIISGLSLGVIVVEAEMRSGSLITARLAGEQGREVFAVPGSPLDPRAAGCNDLLRQGATLCADPEDVLRVVESFRGFADPPPTAPTPLGEDPDDEALRQRLADLLSPTPVARDDLVRITGAAAAEVNAALIELALAGRAALLPGGLVSAA
jgi:DNA processing protein